MRRIVKVTRSTAAAEMDTATGATASTNSSAARSGSERDASVVQTVPGAAGEASRKQLRVEDALAYLERVGHPLR